MTKTKERKERNRELVLLRKSDPERWSFNNLARYFSEKEGKTISPQACSSIWKRNKDKYGGQDGQK